MSQSTRKRRSRKRKSNQYRKPYPDFPLTIRQHDGRIQKKIRAADSNTTKTYYFGRMPDWQSALELYQKQRDDLYLGKVPREKLSNDPEAVPLHRVINEFLTHKRDLLEIDELAHRTFQDYLAVGRHLADFFGRDRLVSAITKDDFADYRKALAKRFGPTALTVELQRIRTIFKFAWDEEIITAPVRYGTRFKAPSKKARRMARVQNGERMLEPADLRRVLKAAGTPLRAMVLLALNAGLGNSDLANLPIKAIDLKSGWINFARVKTGIPRRCPLWPETIKAIKAALADRPFAKDAKDDEILFLTPTGQKWVRISARDVSAETERLVVTDKITGEFAKLLAALKLKRAGISFYALRHIHRTISAGSLDREAANLIMGHSDGSMSEAYIERIDDGRLQAVANHIRGWLFTSEKGVNHA
jgi:integrase